MQAAGSFYMSIYFLLVDQLSRMTHNLQMLSYYMETGEQGSRHGAGST